MATLQPILRPILSPLTRAIGAAGGGGGWEAITPKATRFVSQSATNDYALGVDAGAGSTKEAPWLTLDYAIANSVSGDVIQINDGTYAAATTYGIYKNLSIVARAPGLVNLRHGGGQARVMDVNGSVTVRLYGVVLDALATAASCITVGSSNTFTINTLFNRVTFKDATTQFLFANGQKILTLDAINCVAQGSTTIGLNIQGHETGAVTINGLAFNCDLTGTGSKFGINYIAAAAGGTFSASGVTGELRSAAASGVVIGIQARNRDSAQIASCNINIAAPSTVGTLYAIVCDSLTLSANGGAITNSRGHLGTNGGYCIRYGQDSSTAGDGRQNNGNIAGNIVSANPSAASPVHGLMLGYGTGGTVSNNTVTGAALATIAKQQTGGTFSGNTLNEFTSEAIRSKGSNGTTWSGNTLNFSAGFAGDGININSNDSPVTASTGVVISSNVLNINAAPVNIVEVTAGSDAAFSGNTYNVNVALGAGAWNYQGTGYNTLAAWKAVEPTALP